MSAEELQDIARKINHNQSRVLAEDESGWKYEVKEARVFGSNTDDPGLVLKLHWLGSA